MASSTVNIHPLDPLSVSELSSAVAQAKVAWDLDHRYLFAMVQLDEPTKTELAGIQLNKPVARRVRMTLWDKSRGAVSEGVLVLGGDAGALVEIDGAKAPVLSSECEQAIAAARADARVVKALRDRGISDVSTVYMETWPIGAQMPKYLDTGRRVIWTPMWHCPTPQANFYAHPIGGLHAIVDLDTCEVVDVENDQQIPIPRTPGPYRASQTGANVGLKDLVITQPDGPSFTVNGWRIDWERWNMRIGFCQREGLVIHEVHFGDNGVERRIARRMSIAELVIPYGDPSQSAYRKNAFDTGEFGLGNYTNSLTLGCDCLGEIVYLDVAITQPDGSIREIPNAICMHEEDVGILWKHVDYIDGHVEVRRGRRFVVSSICTVNNYEYGYFWYFYQDGSIEFEAKLTGIVLTVSDFPGVDHPSATEVEPGLWAPFHQHILCARLDMDIDGAANSVVEVDAFAHPIGPKNPYGGAYETSETVLASESVAQRVIDPFKNRFWKIINPGRRNHMGKPVGYKLVPGHTTFPMALPESVIGRKAGFMYKHLWVTPHVEEERYPAGDYPFQHDGGAGLPDWTSANRNVDNTDIVLWYVFGTNHIPRVEDWPVMPVERTGFQLKPSGFFSRSPGIDVAVAKPACH